MIVKKILELPYRIIHKGTEYSLILFPNGSNDFRICYESNDKEFCFLIENITNDNQLLEAVSDTKKWLTENNHIKL